VSDPYKHKSKFLSLILRHDPGKAGVTLDEAGWVDVDALLEGCARAGQSITLDELREIVRTSDKQRFALSEDGRQIRANQGHSVTVDLGYDPAEPPAVLYHGTADRFLTSIRTQGLLKGARHHVHLSERVETASQVGTRHGRLALLEVNAAAMQRDGNTFYRTQNGVWLVDHVPARYLKEIDRSSATGSSPPR